MASCASCGSTVIFGGKSAGERRFCSDACLQRGALLSALDQVPPELLAKQTQEVHQGTCPKCSGSGPVDVHTSHRVWSAVVMTSWSSRPQICCRSCGIKGKVGDAAFSLFLGWWGLPWGVIMTPIQVLRNLAGIISSPDPAKPSKQLETMVGLEIATKVLQIQQSAAVQPGKG